MRTSTIILSKNIKIDKDYINVLSYNVEQMLNLLKSSNNLVKMINNCSFLRDRNYFTIEIDYNLALKVNYLAFTNPDYSNKWFFAFVDKVEYVSNKAVNIYYTLDHWTTWFDDWTPAKAYVIREHASSYNSIKDNTIPEDLYYGPYKAIDQATISEYTNTRIIAGLTIDPNSTSSDVNNVSGIYQGLPSGCAYYVYSKDVDGIITLRDHLEHINAISGPGGIIGVSLAPQYLTGNGASGSKIPNSTSQPSVNKVSINSITNLDGYTPVNKKLLTYPYCFVRITNSSGGSIILKQEDWDDLANREVNVRGCLSMSSDIVLYPVNYAGLTEDLTSMLSLGKYPQLSYQTDTYNNWFRQNALNQATSYLTGGLQIAGGILNMAQSKSLNNMTSGAYQTLSGAEQIANANYNKYLAETVPPSFSSAVNVNDVLTASNKLNFYIEYMTIKSEYAKMLDDYLSRYGYKTLRYKIPNISTRSTFNYLQISNDSVIGTGDVPAESMSIINNIARRGVTIYQNHSLI